MLQVSDVKESFLLYKRDISDVNQIAGLFLEWTQFTLRYIYDKVKREDAGRFVKSNSYAIVLPPQTEALPTDYLDMRQTQTGLYFYDSTKYLYTSFDETGDVDITFTDTGGTSAYNENIKVQGGSSRGYTGDAAATMNLSYGTNIDWTNLQHGGAASPDNDFISIWVYIGNTIPTTATLEFSTSNAGTDVGVNQFSYDYTSLVAGWNRIKVAKSAFTQLGTPDWNSLGYLRLIYSGGDTTTNVYWDKLELVESEVNGKGQTNQKLAMTGYGVREPGYYLEGSYITFTDNQELLDREYVMKYLPIPPTLVDEDSYLTVDATITGAEIVEDRHLEYMVKAVDVLYTQWDVDAATESIADFRFVRILEDLLDGYMRQPQISIMNNPINNF